MTIFDGKLGSPRVTGMIRGLWMISAIPFSSPRVTGMIL